ncbi:MAG: HTH-type transcriptional regulator BhcR [Pseudomonadota bacterium]
MNFTPPPQKNLRRARGRPRGWDDKTAQNTIKSLDRAMEIFEYLSTNQGLPLSALATELKQSPATVYRVLITLETRGLVEFDAEEQLWHVGSRAFEIGTRFLRRTSLVDRARPILRDLMEETGETANLGVERGGMVLFLNQVETHESIRAFFPPGTLSDMHASGIGKALLANMEPRRLKTWLRDRTLANFTPHTMADPDELIDELELTRARGYSIDAEEKNIGMRCVAAPVFNMYGEAVAGISVSGPTSRIGLVSLEDISATVMSAANALSLAIGGGSAVTPPETP